MEIDPTNSANLRTIPYHYGMSKREYLATTFMKELINSRRQGAAQMKKGLLAKAAVECADALIKELGKDNG